MFSKPWQGNFMGSLINDQQGSYLSSTKDNTGIPLLEKLEHTTGISSPILKSILLFSCTTEQ